MPKYTGQQEVINDIEEYEFLKEKRGLKEIRQNEAIVFQRGFKRSMFNVRKHIWSQGDRMYKLSATYYGDIKYWWLIALWNNCPTDSDYYYGQEVEIPGPIDILYREVTDELD